MRDIQIAAALIRQGDQILLIRQQCRMTSRDYWTLPAGKVEKNELLHEALKREVKEETGLIVSEPFQLIYYAQTISEPRQIRWLTFAFSVGEASGILEPNDPDGHVLEAKYFPLEEALRLIGAYQPLEVMKTPILSYLQDPASVAAGWFYRETQPGQMLLSHR